MKNQRFWVALISLLLTLMTPDALFNTLSAHFPFNLNSGQELLLQKLSSFFLSETNDQIFIMKGYAGTGKTTIVRSLVKALPAINGKTVLLAPTGRAAKVLSNYTRKSALTIHKKIYIKEENTSGAISFKLRPNIHKDTVFIVDEASMISNARGLSFGGNTSVLDDLLSFVFNGLNCKLLLIGDTAQLPPVGLDVSPALDPEYLKVAYYFSVEEFVLTEVMRQTQDSGILMNATTIRSEIAAQSNKQPHFSLNDFKDITRINGEELEDELNSAYNNYGAEDTMIICRSNKRANIFNQQIRARIRWQEDEISAGDYMMVVKNNYFWLPEESKAGFIANGDIVKLQRVGNIQEMHGFRFADVKLKLIDYPDEPELETRILLDTIMSESPALSSEDNKKLYHAVWEDYEHIRTKKERYKKVKEDPFFNALQVKFAYAITCHKSQGGQWPCVFVEQGYLTDEMVNTEYLRWLYTALTRASEKLYLVNFNPAFFGEEKEEFF